ncbi:hypothetical protein KP509_19G032400 [Ceratopteris richardii]|uniref:Uncharacterized protein n=1 Tax=Ceratopteris richardii TaxID=49495 RepID=A0A8T2SMB5_CERRI|nr:hypothetical protein KP509_24G066400 [Ceratopteris richardii]KAH7352155.1 hypothetical protein KP509_19G032400 [Ceratopteris richardii]
MESGLFSMLPWLMMPISANLGGWTADTLVSITKVRKIWLGHANAMVGLNG